MSWRLYPYALRTARPRQLRARLTAPVTRRRFSPARLHAFRPLDAAAGLWRSAAYAESEHADILGSELPWPASAARLRAEPRLRRFHYHYCDAVLGLARRGEAARAAQMLEAWIAAYPPRPGDAWHPYVVSIRVRNWLAALTLEPGLAAPRVVDSVGRQLAYLARNVENGVLGNHVIRNAVTLLLGGIGFHDADLRDRGLALLRRELTEQVLRDGGHYERSPVYHSLVLRDLLEARVAGELEELDEVIARMSRFAAALARPDGKPAPFNDGPLELAPALDLPPPPEGLVVFPETGYAVWRAGGVWVAFDCGPPAPPFLPAHAHADALSVQAWADGVEVLADPGTYTYEPGPDRDWFRGTAAHSTVTVGGRNQFELWGAFRSGPLPEVAVTSVEGDAVTASAAYGGIRHERRVRLERRHVTLEDTVAGHVEGPVVSRLVPAPGAALAARADAELEPEPGWVSERLYERTPVDVRCGSGSWRVDL